MSDTPHVSLYRRLTRSVPIVVTVILHAVVILIAGYFIVNETIIKKKKTFEEAPMPDNSFKKEVEHRLQVARKAGGSAPSPVSAQRIVTTAADALQLPDMPELPQVGASSLSSMGFGAGMGAVGAGSSYNTGIGGAGGTGAGFMSMSFLGVTSDRVSKVVFAVDISTNLMDIQKGGFKAFSILRDEIMRLVGQLPLAAEFNVILFDNREVRMFGDQLLPGTSENKTRFFAWMKRVNSSSDNIGMRSAIGSIPWKRVVPPNTGIDPEYHPYWWTAAIHAALELKPEVVFIITGSGGYGQLEVSEAEYQKRVRDYEKADKENVETFKKMKIDLDEVIKARNAALRKANADLAVINHKLEAKGKDPFIVTSNRIAQSDFLAAVRASGYDLKIDPTGWSTPDGKLIWLRWGGPPNRARSADFTDVQKYISRLESFFVPKMAPINIFYFVGPSFKPDQMSTDFGKLATRYNGRFDTLTTERLQQLQNAADKAEKAGKK